MERIQIILEIKLCFFSISFDYFSIILIFDQLVAFLSGGFDFQIYDLSRIGSVELSSRSRYLIASL